MYLNVHAPDPKEVRDYSQEYNKTRSNTTSLTHVEQNQPYHQF